MLGEKEEKKCDSVSEESSDMNDREEEEEKKIDFFSPPNPVFSDKILVNDEVVAPAPEVGPFKLEESKDSSKKMPLKKLIRDTPPNKKLRISRDSIIFFKPHDAAPKQLKVKIRAISLLQKKEPGTCTSEMKIKNSSIQAALNRKSAMRHTKAVNAQVLPQNISADFWNEIKREVGDGQL